MAREDSKSNSLAGIFFIFIFAGLVFVANYFFAVQTQPGQLLDNRVLEQAEFTYDAVFPLTAVKPVVIMSALLLLSAFIWYRQGLFKAVATLFVAGFSMLASQFAKLLLPREQLTEVGAIEGFTENTLPSGHMSVFVTLAILLLLNVPKRFLNLSYWLSFLVLIIASWQLLDYGWHRPSDLIAALSLTLAAVSLMRMLVPKALRYEPKYLDIKANEFRGQGFVTAATVIMIFSAIAFAMWIGLITLQNSSVLQLAGYLLVAGAAIVTLSLARFIR